MFKEAVRMIRLKQHPLPTYRPEIKIRDVGWGWIRPYLYSFDTALWGRWDYWIEIQITRKIPEGPIPQISLGEKPDTTVLKMLEKCIDALTARGQSRHRAITYLTEWLLFGLGDKTQTEKPINHGARNSDPFPVLYQIFVLPMMQTYPYDYLGHLLTEIGHGKKSTAFYPTPHALTSLMARLTMQDSLGKHPTVCDPCVGTGRTLIEASNHSLRLSGQDIDSHVLGVCRINLWLYAPWGIAPFPAECFGD